MSLTEYRPIHTEKRRRTILSNLNRLGLAILLSPIVVAAQIVEHSVSSSDELEALFADPVDSVHVFLSPGTYELQPRTIVDSTCGNCEDPATRVVCTVGLHIRGAFVHLQGPAEGSAVIRTHAGYGLFLERCASAILENLVVTGGERDTSGLATDAAIVVKNSNAVIRKNRIVDNIGDSTVVSSHVVGIMGICGRDNSHLVITENEIIRNSWDGIALFRGAEAEIGGNIIDGVDKARGNVIGGGRGVAIELHGMRRRRFGETS